MAGNYEKPDFYTKKAKSEGYLARSIYKLEEMDEKFKLFKRNQRVLDLGCAPGSWSQYVSNIVGEEGYVVGIDYKQILVAAKNFIVIHGNFYREDNQEKIKGYAPYDAIISDMAPDTSGDRLTDCFNSSELVKTALLFAYDYLKKGGFFIAKIFQGGDEKEIMEMVKYSFREAKWFKPNTCRKNSFETFIIGIGYYRKYEDENSSSKNNETDDYSGVMPW